MGRVRNISRQTLLATHVLQARSLLARMKGLLGRESLAQGEGLWIEPCPSIHTFFMQFSIDVIFVDRSWKVLHLIDSMAPQRLSRYVSHARGVLELPAGTIIASHTQVHDELCFEDS